MPWHRNCQSVMIKAVRSARLGNWKMDHSTNREVICTKCQVQIDGRAIALSATEYICSNCWPFFFRPVLEEKVAASERRREEANDDI